MTFRFLAAVSAVALSIVLALAGVGGPGPLQSVFGIGPTAEQSSLANLRANAIRVSPLRPKG